MLTISRRPLLPTTKPAADAALGLSCLVFHRLVELVDGLVELLAGLLLVLLGTSFGIVEGRLGVLALDAGQYRLPARAVGVTYGLVQLVLGLFRERFCSLLSFFLPTGHLALDLCGSFRGIGCYSSTDDQRSPGSGTHPLLVSGRP